MSAEDEFVDYEEEAGGDEGDAGKETQKK